MPILIDGIVMRRRSIIDTILLYGDEVCIPVVRHPVTVKRRHIIVVGRIRVGIRAIVGIIALPPHNAIGRPIGERPDLVLSLIVGVGAIQRMVGVIEPGIPGINRAQRCPWIGGVTGCPHAVNIQEWFDP